MTMGEIIKHHRKELSLTQSQLGEKVGVGKAAVQKWESGMVSNIKKDTIEKLASLFHISPNELLGYSSEEANKRINEGAFTLKTQTERKIVNIYRINKDYYSFNSNPDNKTKYEFAIFETEANGSFHAVLSDQGKTFKALDNVFEMAEPDVQKNLNAIANECKVKRNGLELFVDIEDWCTIRERTINKTDARENDDADNFLLEDNSILREYLYRLFTCVVFMDTMRIFYV